MVAVEPVRCLMIVVSGEIVWILSQKKKRWISGISGNIRDYLEFEEWITCESKLEFSVWNIGIADILLAIKFTGIIYVFWINLLQVYFNEN